MDENKEKQPVQEPEATTQSPEEQAPEAKAQPVDYSRYMGTLNRIYRRNNNPQKKRLGDGITSLKQEQRPAAEPTAPAEDKKDHSFLIAVGIALAVIVVLWIIKKF